MVTLLQGVKHLQVETSYAAMLGLVPNRRLKGRLRIGGPIGGLFTPSPHTHAHKAQRSKFSTKAYERATYGLRESNLTILTCNCCTDSARSTCVPRTVLASSVLTPHFPVDPLNDHAEHTCTIPVYKDDLTGDCQLVSKMPRKAQKKTTRQDPKKRAAEDTRAASDDEVNWRCTHLQRASTACTRQRSNRTEIVRCKHVQLTYHLRNVRCTQPLTARRVVQTTKNTTQPHVVFIVADDLGGRTHTCFFRTARTGHARRSYSHVRVVNPQTARWHNPDVKTPVLDQLARDGVILNQTYVNYVCTPSRTAFMTGYFPYHVGMQHMAMLPAQPSGVPSHFPFLPEKLKELGYATHVVGKWHLGFCNWNYTPTYRGFDSFYGFYNGHDDYYKHTVRIGPTAGRIARRPQAGGRSDSREGRDRGRCGIHPMETFDNGFRTGPYRKVRPGLEPVIERYRGPVGGLDLRDDNEIVKTKDGEYSTYFFTERIVDMIEKNPLSLPLFLYLPFQNVHEPLQVPKRCEDMYSNIQNENRRIFLGMVSAMDEAIGNVTMAMKRAGLWDNTLLIFTADNGGWPLFSGNNFPLRGGKITLWEGGTRAAAFVHGSMLQKTGYTSDEMIHAVDWFPTILAAAGGTADSGIDGVSQLDTLVSGKPSPRTEFVYNIDATFPTKQGAIRVGGYKLIEGYAGKPDGWIRPDNLTNAHQNSGDPVTGTWLFNLKDDPTEHHNLAAAMPDKLSEMQAKLQDYRKTMVPAIWPKKDPKSNPKNWDGAWSPGWC
ncbi:hypothetical protein Bbelb_302870 [Branchiostoma belcheri]|nr:hypothetical protein Bbelb_302870 [Branchiostoma belcheri]